MSAGDRRAIALLAGENSVGSAGSNTVVLSERGLSRRHATVTVDREGVRVEDLDSKNGTLVNGSRVTRSSLEPGDEIAFGPAVFRLESVDEEDALLGIEVEPSGRREPSGRTLHETTLVPPEKPPRETGGLKVVREVLTRLTLAPRADLDGALAVMVKHLGALAAGLFEWGPDGAAIILSSCGPMRAPPSRAEIERAGADPAVSLGAGDAGAIGTARPLAGGFLLGLVFWGTPPAEGDRDLLLPVLLDLIHAFRPRPLHGIDELAAPAKSKLVFPPTYVRGESPSMVSLYAQMTSLLEGDLPVLIVGETGVGKEPIAQILHASSSRSSGPLVAVNCAAIPAELLEAEMFGVGKGVATGVSERKGKFLEADGGTLFFDEIGDMPLDLQAKLLRALQEKEIQPIGRPPIEVDVRVVSATNQSLRSQMEKGEFRSDLYYRIAGYVLELPPLDRRKEDLPRLIGHFVRASCDETGKSIRGLTVKALRLLTEYSWPGNIRELEHEVRRLAYLCPPQQAIDSSMLSPRILESSGKGPPDRGAPADSPSLAGTLDLGEHTRVLERRLILQALTEARGNQTQAAKLLKISRNGLAKRLKKLGIKPGFSPLEGSSDGERTT